MTASSSFLKSFHLFALTGLLVAVAVFSGITVAYGAEPEQDEYVPMHFENIAKAYWAIGAHNISDPGAIDNYLRINECDLYLKYSKNEFEWNELRNVAKESILHRMASFPTQFEFIREIELKDYDPEEQKFWLDPESQSHAISRLQVNGESPGNICGMGNDVPGYPHIIVFMFNRPFSLVSFPVHPQIAQLYIDEVEANYANMSDKSRIENYKRLAYLRMKVRMTQFKEVEYNFYGDKGIVYARLEGIEIYADKEKTKLLFKQDYKRRRARRAIKKEESKPAAEEVEASESAESTESTSTEEPVAN